MSVRLPDDDVAFYWPPPTSCRRGNVPNSNAVAAILRAHPDPGPGTVNAAVGTVLHGLQVASPAPPRSGASAVGELGKTTISVDMAWTRSPGDLATIVPLPVNL